MSGALEERGGVVRLGDRDVLVCDLSAAKESRFLRDLARLAKRQRGPAGRLGQIAPAVKALRDAGDADLADAALREAVRAELNDAPPSLAFVVEETARTPAGVALELYHRSRSTHPERTLAEFEAVVTDHNAEDVFDAIRDALSGPAAPAGKDAKGDAGPKA